MALAFVFELSKVETPHIRETMVGHLRHVDEDLATRVADGLALSPMPPAPAVKIAPVDLPLSTPLQTIGKMKDTLKGRLVGILIDEGSDAASIKAVRKAVEAAGAAVKIVAPKIGGAKLSDGKKMPADGQLAGTPSVLFDAVAIILTAEAAKRLSGESAAIDFVSDAFGHLKAIAADGGAKALLAASGVKRDAGIVNAGDTKAFITAAKTRQWAREPMVRMLP